MVEQNQQFIFNSDELSLIKNTFAENDTLLYTIRKVFLQFELTDVEVGLLKQAVTPEVLHVLRKRILPDLSPDYPLGQIPSLMTTLTQQIQVKDASEMQLQFEAKSLEEAYLRQRFEVLEGLVNDTVSDIEEIDLKELGKLEGKGPEQQYTDMTAYLFILGYVDPMLILIKAIAGDKNETIEQQKDRMTRDSNK